MGEEAQDAIGPADGQSRLTAELDDACNGMENLGRALVDLGNAMQDKNTTIEELATLSFKAGVQIKFRIA